LPRAFLSRPAALELVLDTPRLQLTLPQRPLGDAALAFHLRNQEHLRRWFPPTPEGFDTPAYWQDYVGKTHEAFQQGVGVRFWLMAREAPDTVIGTIGFSQIFRGPFCNCVLGYQIDGGFEGKGLMHEALQTAIRYMFTEQRLHRINANYRPENARSGRLLTRLGFCIDGYAKNYLFIDGQWRDHIQTSLLNDQFRPDWLTP
jgi:[ribosomal protein S5]-alanine N-acetyltransferase